MATIDSSTLSMTVPRSRGLRVAFLGGGVNSAVGRAHSVAIRMDDCFCLVAGCFSRHHDINVATAIEYGVSLDRCYTNLDKLIENEKEQIDAVIVLTPTPHHIEDLKTLIATDIPIICEKAMVASPTDAREIALLVKEKQGFLVVTYNYSGYPMIRELRHMIRQGKLGQLEQIHIEMPQEGFARRNKDGKPNPVQEWREQDESLPTISLDLGVHLHQMVYFLTGETPQEVVAVENHFGAIGNVVDNISCIAKYSHELLCHMWYSKTALGKRNGLRVQVFGDKGSAEWVQLNPEALTFSDCHGTKTTMDRGGAGFEVMTELRYNRFKPGHPAGFLEAFANHYHDIALSLLNYINTGHFELNENIFGADTAHEGLRMLDAISRSAQKRRWEKID